MKKLALIGGSVDRSFSKIIHSKIANIVNQKITYDLLSLDENEFNFFMKTFKQSDYHGINVTMPYKEDVIPFLDGLTEKASKICAVNTIYKVGNKLIGDNTDYYGFLALVQSTGIDFTNKKVLVLGTGGAAKAVKVVLDELKAKPIYVSRKKKSDPFFSPIINYNAIPTDIDIIVNATPIGSLSNPESPLTLKQVSGKTVIDLVYLPKITKLMSFAAKAYSGRLMLMVQAIKADEKFFSKEIFYDQSMIDEVLEVIHE